jgi:hypothetical protein
MHHLESDYQTSQSKSGREEKDITSKTGRSMNQEASPFTQNHLIHKLRINSVLESEKNNYEGHQKLLLDHTRRRRAPVKHRLFRMTLTVNPCLGREIDSQMGPGSR